MAERTRIDKLLVDRGLTESRERAQTLLIAGRVFVQGQRVDKPGTRVDVSAEVHVRGEACPYVSRGGVDPAGLVCMDVGASTGGFTDVLLQRGAAKVHAVDVGRGQLHAKLRTDPRVVVHEGINARFPLDAIISEPIELVVMDVSFISLTQFELSPKDVGRGGVVRDDALRARAVEKVVSAAANVGLREAGRRDSPVTGPAGNREIFVRLVRASRGGEAR
jgi:23S rRNA (cytidine1920-2'-O)/16S rRNA (cytidine1409-2'-O)-methyltransferase